MVRKITQVYIRVRIEHHCTVIDYLPPIAENNSYCRNPCPNDQWVCTREPGHTGIHVAHMAHDILFYDVLAWWDDDRTTDFFNYSHIPYNNSVPQLKDWFRTLCHIELALQLYC